MLAIHSAAKMIAVAGRRAPRGGRVRGPGSAQVAVGDAELASMAAQCGDAG